MSRLGGIVAIQIRVGPSQQPSCRHPGASSPIPAIRIGDVKEVGLEVALGQPILKSRLTLETCSFHLPLQGMFPVPPCKLPYKMRRPCL